MVRQGDFRSHSKRYTVSVSSPFSESRYRARAKILRVATQHHFSISFRYSLAFKIVALSYTLFDFVSPPHLHQCSFEPKPLSWQANDRVFSHEAEDVAPDLWRRAQKQTARPLEVGIFLRGLFFVMTQRSIPKARLVNAVDVREVRLNCCDVWVHNGFLVPLPNFLAQRRICLGTFQICSLHGALNVIRR